MVTITFYDILYASHSVANFTSEIMIHIIYYKSDTKKDFLAIIYANTVNHL
jgi:hypothetical protein